MSTRASRGPASKVTALAFAGLLGTWCAPASAQWTAEGIDANALPAPIAPSHFSALEGSGPLAEWRPSASLRLSYLASPIVLGLPAPTPGGAQAQAVAGLLLTELTLASGLPLGFDAGLGLGLHTYQWGTGLGPVTGGAGLDPVALADPRLVVGWSHAFDAFALRPYAQLFLPLGDARAFAGEGSTRADLGIALSYRFPRLLLASDVAVRLRETRTIGLTRWGPQIRAGFGASFYIFPELSLGAELLVLPTLTSQEAPEGGEPGQLVPAQARGNLRYELERYVLLASLGAGLPFSRTSSLSDSTWVRGVTSPSFVALFELRTQF